MKKNLYKLLILITPLIIQTSQGFNLRDITTFAKGFLKSPLDVGSPLPCSSSTGYELITYIRRSIQFNPKKPLRILEVGAGTGSVTKIIVRILRPQDKLDLIEVSQDYCSELQKQFRRFRSVSVYCESFENFEPEEPYDFIISTLPINSFGQPCLNNTIESFKRSIEPGGVLSFVSIAGMPQLKRHFIRGKSKRESHACINTLQEFRNKYQIDSSTVLTNIPPLRVYHLQIQA